MKVSFLGFRGAFRAALHFSKGAHIWWRAAVYCFLGARGRIGHETNVGHNSTGASGTKSYLRSQGHGSNETVPEALVSFRFAKMARFVWSHLWPTCWELIKNWVLKFVSSLKDGRRSMLQSETSFRRDTDVHIPTGCASESISPNVIFIPCHLVFEAKGGPVLSSNR